MIGLSPSDPREERDGAEYLESIESPPGGLMTIGLSSFAPLEERDAPYLELTALYNRILSRTSSDVFD